MTGRKFSAKEAREIGFVSQVVEGGRGQVLGELLSKGIEVERANGRTGTCDGEIDCL